MKIGFRFVGGTVAAMSFAAVVAMSAKAAETEHEFGDWTLVEIRDELDDTRRYIAYATNGEGQDRAVLAVKCDKVTEPPYISYIRTRTYFGSSTGRDVRYRVDRSHVTTERWHAMNTSVNNFDNLLAAAMIQRLMNGSEVIIESQIYDYGRVRNTFSLNGSREALSRVVQQCGR